MAQIDQELYAKIAKSYALMDVALSGIATDAKQAVEDIVNITTTNYPEPNPSVMNPDDAIEIELALLGVFNTAYISARNMSLSVSGLLGAIRAVNGYVINNSAYNGTADEKLTDWINTSMNGKWVNTANCPAGWKNLSEDAGYDVTDWNYSA